MVLSRENRNVDDSIDSTTNPHKGPLTLRGAFAASSTVPVDFSSEFVSGSEGVPGRSREGAALSRCDCLFDSSKTCSTVEAIAARGKSFGANNWQGLREI